MHFTVFLAIQKIIEMLMATKINSDDENSASTTYLHPALLLQYETSLTLTL